MKDKLAAALTNNRDMRATVKVLTGYVADTASIAVENTTLKGALNWLSSPMLSFAKETAK